MTTSTSNVSSCQTANSTKESTLQILIATEAEQLTVDWRIGCWCLWLPVVNHSLLCNAAKNHWLVGHWKVWRRSDRGHMRRLQLKSRCLLLLFSIWQPSVLFNLFCSSAIEKTDDDVIRWLPATLKVAVVWKWFRGGTAWFVTFQQAETKSRLSISGQIQAASPNKLFIWDIFFPLLLSKPFYRLCVACPI